MEAFAVAADDVADGNGVQEGHGLDRDGDDAAMRDFFGEDGTADVHLRHNPAAEDVAVGVGVGVGVGVIAGESPLEELEIFSLGLVA